MDTSLQVQVEGLCKEALEKALDEKDKALREEKVKAIHTDCLEQLKDLDDSLHDTVKKMMSDIEKNIVRSWILERDKRMDGRTLQEIRPISCKVDYLDEVHGSALFTRGQTQVLGVVTLGSPKIN